MRRLEYTRRTRSAPGHARNASEAVLVLAQVTRERQRLQQERSALEKRIRNIELRLSQIAGTETRLVPAIQLQLDRMSASVPAQATAVALPPGTDEVTLRY